MVQGITTIRIIHYHTYLQTMFSIKIWYTTFFLNMTFFLTIYQARIRILLSKRFTSCVCTNMKTMQNNLVFAFSCVMFPGCITNKKAKVTWDFYPKTISTKNNSWTEISRKLKRNDLIILLISRIPTRKIENHEIIIWNREYWW